MSKITTAKSNEKHLVFSNLSNITPESSNVSPLNSTQLDSQSITPDTNLINFNTLNYDELSKKPVLPHLSPLSSNLSNVSPNNPLYYSSTLSKDQFNSISINSAILILKLYYPNQSVIQLKFFIKEILKRSKTSIQTLQLSLYYILKANQSKDRISSDPNFKCPKKLFLISIILASKFNNDKNYSFKSWSKISGLSFDELILIEKLLLKNLNYELYLSKKNYETWCDLLILIGFDILFKDSTINFENIDLNKSNFLKWFKYLSTFKFNSSEITIHNIQAENNSNIEVSRKRNFNDDDDIINVKKLKV